MLDTNASRNGRNIMKVSENPPGFLKRIAAITYDLFLLLPVWFIAISIGMAISWLFTGDFSSFTKNNLGFIYMELATFLFFGWFWTHGGQTLGMRAWRLKVVKEDGGQLQWSQALVRYLYAQLSWLLLGIGFLMILIDRNKLALHDKLSHTYLQMLEKES